MRKTDFRITVLLVIAVIAGISLGVAFKDVIIYKLAGKKQATKLTNPILDSELGREALENNELRPFKHKLSSLIEKKFRGKVEHISVYFRDLNNGPWFSIKPDNYFAPGSLLKAPLMIAILKEAEANPEFLKNKIRYEVTYDHNFDQRIVPRRTLELGKIYTIEDMLFLMIAYSDNNAYFALENLTDPKILKKTYSDLGIMSPYSAKQENFITVVSYGTFLRILYNSSYLNREMSEKALGYLSKTTFKDGLAAGIPSNIVIAHKFGEQTIRSKKNIRHQLHDCGIIYYPDHPYLLCIMTGGESFEYLDDAIREISRVVYEEIDIQHKK